MNTTTENKKGRDFCKSATPTTIGDDIALVAAVGGELRADSRLLALHLGNRHKNVRELIVKHENSFKRLGILPFETEVLDGPGQGERYVLLNETQSHFLLSLSRNTSRVVELKLRLVLAFADARRNSARATRSTVADRRSLYLNAAEIVVFHRLLFSAVYRAISERVGAACFAT